MDTGAGSAWRVSTERMGDTHVVHVAGEIDLDTAPKLEQALARLPFDGPMVIECSRIVYFDLSGVHALENLVARHQGAITRRIVLAAVPPQVRRVLDLAGVSGTFRVAESVGEALQILRGGTEGRTAD